MVIEKERKGMEKRILIFLLIKLEINRNCLNLED